MSYRVHVCHCMESSSRHKMPRFLLDNPGQSFVLGQIAYARHMEGKQGSDSKKFCLIFSIIIKKAMFCRIIRLLNIFANKLSYL